MIREKIFHLFKDEIPYHTTVIVKEFKEKSTLIKIRADIIVQRETQKGIILGEGGKMIKQLGTEARKDIETIPGQKSFPELFVKVRPKWRDNEYDAEGIRISLITEARKAKKLISLQSI